MYVDDRKAGANDDMMENLAGENIDQDIDDAYMESLNAKVNLLLNPEGFEPDRHSMRPNLSNQNDRAGSFKSPMHSPAVSQYAESKRNSIFQLPRVPMYEMKDYEDYESPYRGFSFLSPGLMPPMPKKEEKEEETRS